MRSLSAALSGALFGAGLYISGMVDTIRVQGWLDVFGDWDPTLAFVMAGAILPMALAWYAVRHRPRALLGTEITPLPPQKLGLNLTFGSFLFGAGWGLAGLCPGPAVASLSFGGWGGAVFLLAMLAGMLVAPAVRVRIDRLAGATAP